VLDAGVQLELVIELMTILALMIGGVCLLLMALLASLILRDHSESQRVRSRAEERRGAEPLPEFGRRGGLYLAHPRAR